MDPAVRGVTLEQLLSHTSQRGAGIGWLVLRS
jgi:hypothetical protein